MVWDGIGDPRPEKSGGVHRPDPRSSCAFTRCIQKPPMPEVSDQLPAAALARARWLQAARKAFISARNTIIRVATPLYFFVVPVTVRLTAPW